MPLVKLPRLAVNWTQQPEMTRRYWDIITTYLEQIGSFIGIISGGNGIDFDPGTGVISLDNADTQNTDHAAVLLTADAGLTGGGDITASRSFAVGQGAGILVNPNDVSVSAKLQLYDGGDTPSAFTLSIVDSADALAWRTAIGAGTGNGTVTSVAASGGTTGLTFSGSPITTSGTLTLSGTLVVANGGTGLASMTSNTLYKGNGTSPLVVSTITDDGTNITTGNGVSTAQCGIEVAGARSGSGASYIDLHSTSGSDYEARLIRASGTNGTLLLTQKGTGDLYITTENAAIINMQTNGATRLSISPTGTVTIPTLTATTINSPTVNNLTAAATPNTNWTIDASTSSNFVTILNNGTYDLAAGSGLISAFENGGFGAGLFFASFGVVAIIYQNGTGFTNTSGTAGKINVYYNGSSAYRFQNLTGGTINLYITTIKVRPNT